MKKSKAAKKDPVHKALMDAEPRKKPMSKELRKKGARGRREVEEIRGQRRIGRTKRRAEDEVNIDVVAGVEGPSVYLNDSRIAGPKLWGGGKVTHHWRVHIKDLREDIKMALTGMPK